MNIKPILKKGLFALSCILLTNNINAVTLTPAVVEMNNEKEFFTSFEITNPTQDPIAVEFSLKEIKGIEMIEIGKNLTGSTKHSYNGFESTGKWLDHQKKLYKNNELSIKKIKLLSVINPEYFVISDFQDNDENQEKINEDWQKHYETHLDYYNNTKVPIKKEIREETDDLISSIEQIVLDVAGTKGAKKKVRVQYIGGEFPEKERIFRVIAKELNINMNKESGEKRQNLNAQIKIRFSFEGLIIIKRKDWKPELIITDIKQESNSLDFQVYNKGKSSDFLRFDGSNDLFAITTNNKRIKLKKDSFKQHSFKRILPNKNVKFSLNFSNNEKIKEIEIIKKEKKLY